MPNHVTNRVTFNAPPEQIIDILEAIKSDEQEIGSIDFNKIIPMPPSLRVTVGSISMRAMDLYTQYENLENDENIRQKFREENFRDDEMFEFGKLLYQNQQEHGYTDWYNWSISNWDTKWNAYDCWGDEDSDYIEFLTAWSPPEAILHKLSEMYPEVGFRHAWADEDIGNNVGEKLYVDGEVVECDMPIPYSKEAYEMAAEILTIELAEHGFYLNPSSDEYEYHEDGAPNFNAKPDCPLIGTDGNIFNLMGIASRTLKDCGMYDEAAAMQNRITASSSYEDALKIIGEYVNFTSADGDPKLGSSGMKMS